MTSERMNNELEAQFSLVPGSHVQCGFCFVRTSSEVEAGSCLSFSFARANLRERLWVLTCFVRS